MKQLLIALAGIFLVTLNAKAQDFKEYVYQSDHFAVSMPDEPKATTRSIPTPLGPIPMNIYMDESPSDEYVYGVAKADYSSLRIVDAQKALNGGRDGMLKNMKATEVSEKPITLDGNPGLEVVYTFPGGPITYNGIVHLYIVGNLLYQVQGNSKIADDPNSKKFLDSFRLLK